MSASMAPEPTLAEPVKALRTIRGFPPYPEALSGLPGPSDGPAGRQLQPAPVGHVVGALVVFVAAVFTVGILAQHQPPYPM